MRNEREAMQVLRFAVLPRRVGGLAVDMLELRKGQWRGDGRGDRGERRAIRGIPWKIEGWNSKGREMEAEE